MTTGLRSFASWFTQTLADVQARVAAVLATREGRAAPLPAPRVTLPRARANNGKVVLVRCGNRAERRAAARFERRHFGTAFAQVDHLLKTVFPPKRPRRA